MLYIALYFFHHFTIINKFIFIKMSIKGKQFGVRQGANIALLTFHGFTVYIIPLHCIRMLPSSRFTSLFNTLHYHHHFLLFCWRQLNTALIHIILLVIIVIIIIVASSPSLSCYCDSARGVTMVPPSLTACDALSSGMQCIALSIIALQCTLIHSNRVYQWVTMQRNALKCGAIKSKIMQSTAMYAVKLYCYSVEQNGMQCKGKTRGTKSILKHY